MTTPASDRRTVLGFVPQLVVFDVDGTLQDTFQWWPRVLRQGLAVFTARSGVVVPPPPDADACAVVGLPDLGVWGAFLPSEHRHRWREVRSATVPLEVAELRSGRDYLFSGIRELLGHLRRIGVAVALASNCRSTYFAAVCEGQGLRALSDWQFCLDSAEGCDKTRMIRLAMAAAGTERAVMVGDRDSDRVAARAAGIPFVWRVNAHCSLDDVDGCWNGEPDGLLSLLGLPPISSGVLE